jgi:hypothetical protein
MDEGVDPKDMCRRVVTALDQYAELESLANPQIRALFIDWMEELEGEILAFIREARHPEPENLSDRFRISKQGAEFLLGKLKQEGKISQEP